MARPCSVCTDSRRAEINAGLTEGRPMRDISEQFRIALSSLHRHAKRHLGRQLAEVEVGQSGTLLDRVAALARESARLGRKAERAGDLRTALAAVREMTRLAELVGRLTGALGVRVEVAAKVGIEVDGSLDFINTPEHWARMVELKALEADVQRLLPPELRRETALDDDEPGGRGGSAA